MPADDKSVKSLNRRQFLGTLAGVTTSLIVPSAFAGIKPQGERILSFYNTHTGEKLTAAYWAEGEYIAENLAQIDWLLRDHRAGEAQPMDRQLLDTLYALQCKTDCGDRPFHIISGYRSPHTNAKLRNNSKGVAKKSLHMQGRAIDIRIPRFETKKLRQAALSLKAGGVGYYPRSNFIHIDTGRVRFW